MGSDEERSFQKKVNSRYELFAGILDAAARL